MSSVSISSGSGPMDEVLFLSGNSGGPVGPDITGTINIVGSGAINIVGDPSANTLTASLTGITQHDVLVGGASNTITSIDNGTTGQVLTANTGDDPSWQDIPAGGITTINGDTGTTGTSTTPTIFANNASNNCGQSVIFTGDDTSTLTLSVTDSNNNVIIGRSSGSALGTGSENVGLGAGCLLSLTAGCTGNCAIGLESLSSLNSGSLNIAIGTLSLAGIVSGAGNLCIAGYKAGYGYTGSESGNILLNSMGSGGESNVLRICDSANTTTGSPLTAAYIGGIDGVALTTATVVTEVSDQLGTAVLTGGTGITIDSTSTPNQIIFNASGGGSGITTINGDTGSVTGSTIHLYANSVSASCGSSVSFKGSGSEMDLSISDVQGNIIIGSTSGIPSPGASCYGNTSIGNENLTGITSAQDNSLFGLIGDSLTSGKFNSFFGAYAGSAIQTGNNNTFLAYQSGLGYYTGSESSNISIGTNSNNEVTGVSNCLRIGGGTGTGDFELSSSYISGIDGVNLTTATVVTEVSDQLGTAVLTGGTGITIDSTSTPNQIIFNATPGGGSVSFLGAGGPYLLNQAVTSWLAPFNGYMSGTDQAIAQWAVPAAGTLSNLYVQVGAFSGSSCTVTVNKNGANTSMVATITGTGTFSDLIDTETFAVGDLLQFEMSSGATQGSISVKFTT